MAQSPISDPALLFIAPNRIGDAILASALLRAALEEKPDQRWRITIAASPQSAPLFGAVPGLQHMHIMQKGRYASHWLGLWRKVIGQRWARVIDCRRSAIGYLLWAKSRHIPPKNSANHHHLQSLAAALGRSATPPLPKLWTHPQHQANAQKLLAAHQGIRPIIALGPTANWAGKIWPAENFIALIQAIRATAYGRDAAFAIFGGPSERLQAAPVLREIARSHRIDLVGKLDLLSAAATLARCDFFIGNDSGLMHMAAAMGTPTLGLFGPSRDEIYHPWGPHCAWVRTNQSFEELTQAPGYDHRTTGSLMAGLSVETALTAFSDLAARQGCPLDAPPRIANAQ